MNENRHDVKVINSVSINLLSESEFLFSSELLLNDNSVYEVDKTGSSVIGGHPSSDITPVGNAWGFKETGVDNLDEI